jgi:hypothetical protein
MSEMASWLRAFGFCIVVLFARTGGPAAHRAAVADSAKKAYCTAPEYRQFNFWVGDWDAYDVDKPNVPVARNCVDLILDGCVLREDYRDTTGHHGQSFSIYDSSRKVWHQTWVTNRGELLVIEGTFEAGKMILEGVDHPDGTERHVRGVWKPVPEGVRETAVTSTDGGKTWKPWFDIIFRPHKP